MPISGPDVILYEVTDGIATVTINRPERMNALGLEAWDRLDETWLRFDKDPDARVAILTGAGDRSFCAGGDLKEFAETGARRIHAQRRYGTRYPSAMHAMDVAKPIIAAVNGYALAGGFLLAQRSDIRIAAEHARFGITEAKVGRAAPWAVPLAWAVPSAVALELLLTGELFSAQRMYEVGFLNRVVPFAELMPEARRMAERIRDNAPLTVAAHKRMFYRALDAGPTVGAMLADETCAVCYESEDCQEGQLAFKEKRAPRWKGR